MRFPKNCILLLALLGTSDAYADILVLRDGTRLEGRVENVAGSPDRLSFTSSTGRLEFPASRISERIEEPDEVDFTRIGDQFLKARNHTAAVQNYQRALEAKSDHEGAREGLKTAQAAIAAEQSERARQAQESMGKELEQVAQMIETEKFQEAEVILSRIVAAESSEQQRLSAQRMMRDLYLAWGFSRFDRMDKRGAEEKYLRVLEMDPQNADARDRLLEIWKDDPQKRPEVLKAYQAKLAEEPNNLEYNRIVGELLYGAERFAEAVEPLKKVASAPRYAGQGFDTRLRRAYRQSINDMADAGKLDEAIRLSEDMHTVFPNEDPTNLMILRYERDKRRLAEDDWDGRALLVQRLREAGLSQFAQREAELILQFDPENEIADSILRSEAEGEFRRIQEAFRNQEYLVSRDMANKFITNEKRYPDLVRAAEELRGRADIESQRQAKENREAAQQLAERGLGYYNEAMQQVTLMQDQTVRTDFRPISNKQRAIDLSRRAIEHMETALRIDPTLGPMSGMDLTARLRDAKALYNGLTDRPTPLPRVRNR